MRVVGPAVSLPVTVDDLAAQIHLDDAEGPQIEALLGAATDVVEAATNRLIMAREVEIVLPDGGWSEFWLPCAPVAELIDAEGLELVRGFDEPRILRRSYAGDSVRALVGYGASDTPAPRQLRQAIILIVSEWREAAISVEGTYEAPRVSFGAQRLIRQVRYRRPREFV